MAAILKFKNKVYNEPEDEITFDSYIRFSLCMFRGVLFDFQPLNEASVWKRFVYFIKGLYVRLNLSCIIICCLSMMAYGLANADNFINAAAAVPNATVTLLIGIKGWIVFFHKKDIWEIFQEMKKMFDRRTGQNKKYGVKKYLDNYHRYITAYAIIYCVFVPMIALPIVPFLLYGTMSMSVAYWFPFDIFRKETFPIYLFWTDWMATSMSFYILGADSILYSLITVIAMEFDILKVDLMNIAYVERNERPKTLSHLIDHHNRLMEISDKLQKIFDMTFLYSLVISSLVMCFIAFKLSLPNADYAFYMPFLCMAVGLIMLLCVFGQRLIDSSEGVAEGIYQSGWENLDDHDFKKKIVLILMRAQKAKKFTAMNFATVSLSSFTTVSLLTI